MDQCSQKKLRRRYKRLKIELLQQGKFPGSLVVENPGYLMGDDVQKIGVWGMGRIGKTTIMKLVQNIEEPTFDFERA